MSVTVLEGFVNFRVRVSPALKVTEKLSGTSVKLPSGLIVPVAMTIPLRESVTVRAAAATGHVKVCPFTFVQLLILPESIELQAGEPPLLEQVSVPDGPVTVAEREEMV